MCKIIICIIIAVVIFFAFFFIGRFTEKKYIDSLKQIRNDLDGATRENKRLGKDIIELRNINAGLQTDTMELRKDNKQLREKNIEFDNLNREYELNTNAIRETNQSGFTEIEEIKKLLLER